MKLLLVFLFVATGSCNSFEAGHALYKAGESGLKLTTENGKQTSDGVYQNDGRFAGWISTTVQIFWDIQFATSGNLDIAFNIGNDASQAGNVFEITLGDDKTNTTIRGTSTSSGGYFTPKLMPMGTIQVTSPKKLRLSIRAVNIKGGVAGDLYYVLLTGNPSNNAHVVDVYPPRADSIHLTYEHGDDALMYYNDVIPYETFPATYFCTSGFNSGYMGFQHNDFKDYKQAIFSLWDVVDQENKAARDELAGVVRVGKGVKIERFGGEGTGYKSTFPFPWKVGEKVQTLLVVEQGQNGYVHFTGFIYMPNEKQWKLMSTLKRTDNYKYMKGYYSFLEDWLGGWGYMARSASFNPWVRKLDGTWVQSKTATFTQAGTLDNVNGWLNAGRFYMRTGGDTINTIAGQNNFLRRNVNDKLPDVLIGVDDMIKHQSYLP